MTSNHLLLFLLQKYYKINSISLLFSSERNILIIVFPIGCI